MFFEVGLYKVHIYSRSVPCRNHRSAQPQFGEAESHSSPDAQLYISVRPAFLLALHFLNRRTSGCTDQWIQIDYRYVLYMAPLQKTQTISLSTESTCPRPAGGLHSVGQENSLAVKHNSSSRDVVVGDGSLFGRPESHLSNFHSLRADIGQDP